MSTKKIEKFNIGWDLVGGEDPNHFVVDEEGDRVVEHLGSIAECEAWIDGFKKGQANV